MDFGITYFRVAIVITVTVVIISLLIACLKPVFGSNSNYSNYEHEIVLNTANGVKKNTNNQAALDVHELDKKKTIKLVRKDNKSVFTHKWLACSLKGHSSTVLDIDFSSNGKYLLSSDDDRSCFIWHIKDWGQKKNITSTKVPMELDHASRAVFSPDSKAFLVNLYNSRAIKVYKLGKHVDSDKKGLMVTAAHDFQHQSAADAADLISLGISTNGRFIMTCYSDTTIKLWSLKGDILCNIDSCHMTNNMALVSPCGRFVASCGFTPDVKVWEVCFDKGGNFINPPVRVFELKGHNAQVCCISFNGNSTTMASISEDGTWKTWDIDVRYKQGEDPRLLFTGQYQQESKHAIPRIAISPDARIVALSSGSNIFVHSCLNGEKLAVFEDVHNGFITKLAFDTKGSFIVSCGGDRVIPVLHNVPGFKTVISDCKSKASSTKNQAQKEMFEQEIAHAKAALSALPC